MKMAFKIDMLLRCWKYRLRTEKESVNFVLNTVDTGEVVIDVGANRGIYTYWLSKKVGNTGKVISFEPQPELIGPLEELKKSFNLDSVVVVNKGLSNSRCTLKMHRDRIGSGGASIEAGKLDDLSIDVEVVRLDDYLEENNILERISFIKADVENHELKVFQGAKNTLRNHKPILLFECHHSIAEKGELFGYLEETGYEGFFFHGSERIDYKKYDAYPYRKKGEIHRNYIFYDRLQCSHFR